jgi:carboxyl-terminal processing protease
MTLGAVGLALITASSAWCLRPTLRVDASTPEGRIAQVTTQLLEQTQFSHQRLDPALASKLIDRYADSLDGSREILFQSDLADFHRNPSSVSEAALTSGDTHPAHVLFDRFLQRFGERLNFVSNALKEEKFDFTAHDRFSLDREKAARPQNAAEAQQLWLQRLRAEYLQEKLGGKSAAQIAETLAHRYESQAKMMKRLSSDTVLELYLNSLAHLYDPHSDYMGREQLQSFNTIMELSLAGIGATLQEDDGYCKIRELVPGGPAARSGKVHVGDRIVGVSQDNGKNTADLVDMPLSQAVDLIRGPKGTTVTLTILPALAEASTRKTIAIQRDEIHLEEQRAKARIVDFPTADRGNLRMGVVDLPAFYASDKGRTPSATADVKKLITKLKSENVHGIILDLRRNGGGSLEEAIHLTGLFIPAGPVVQTRDLAGHIEVGDIPGGESTYDGPLVVLTSRLSASASEIVAGALQDYGRALIVGDSSTFGKGTVQTMLPLTSVMASAGADMKSDPGALKVTISKFYRPSGNSTQLRGVRADIVLPSATDTPEYSESGMKNPMPWDSVPSALYDHFDLVAPYVTPLREESQARVAGDRDFRWLREDLDSLEKNGGRKSVSLNEAERQDEQAQAKAHTKERDAERLRNPEPAAKVYEITVKNAGDPGLPAPMDPKKPTTANKDSQDAADNGDSKPSEIVDIHLRETENILADYVRLLDQRSSPVVTER